MQRQKTFTMCLLTILALSWSAGVAHTSSVNLAIHDEKASVELSLHFFQNMTAMPTLKEPLTGVAAQNLTLAIEESFRNKAGNISVSSLTGEVRSSQDWINSTIHFDVTGIASRSGNLLNINCSWIRFKTLGDLRVGNLSYNLIGATYIRPAFEKYANFDKPPLNETIETVAYQFGTEDISPADAAERAGNTMLLDFSYLVPQVEEWKMTYNLTRAATTWTFNPVPVAEMKMIVGPRDGRPFSVAATYSYNATLSVDGLGQAHGDTITTDVSGGFEPLLMLAAVIATFVVAVVASWIYRSRRKQLPRRRK